MENIASQPSCMSAGESSWVMHFAGFLQASSAHDDLQEMNRQGGGVVSDGSFSSGFSSSFDSLSGCVGTDGDEIFVTSGMACDDEEEDGSLQDTACSSSARPKAKYFVDGSSRQQAAQEVISGGNNNENQLQECNDLRKRGLCLVPLSMLIDYL